MTGRKTTRGIRWGCYAPRGGFDVPRKKNRDSVNRIAIIVCIDGQLAEVAFQATYQAK